MRDFRDAKAMAQTLRAELAPKNVPFSHSECLEIIARIFGAKDWNVLSAAIETAVVPKPQKAAATDGDSWSGPLLLSRDFVLFPKQTAPLFVAREMSRKAIDEARRGGLEILLVAQKEPGEERPRRDGIYDVGVVADVLEVADPTSRDWEAMRMLGKSPIAMTSPPEGVVKLILRGRQRAKIVAVVDEGDRHSAEAQLIQRETVDEAHASAQVRAAQEAFTVSASNDHFRNLSADMRSRMTTRAENTTQPGALADLIAQWAPGTVAEKQRVLEIQDEPLRLEAAVALLRA